ncbi:MAG: hypothetical protein JJ956_01800 [Pseudomonadales bacterium]|nr:hypothetical protein [Pseudomonadales bacterium]
MAEMQEFELFSSATNAVVARYPGRNYPGVLIQGDTLRGLLSELQELQEELEAGDLEAVQGIADVLEERFIEFLAHYENVLEENELELPYPGSVRKLK